jgi:hypothetical protein
MIGDGISGQKVLFSDCESVFDALLIRRSSSYQADKAVVSHQRIVMFDKIRLSLLRQVTYIPRNNDRDSVERCCVQRPDRPERPVADGPRDKRQ